MAKQDEAQYFAQIGNEGVEFTLNKPYSDPINMGSLMHNIAAIATLIHNHYEGKKVRILDIGCGSGWTSNQFALMGHEVVGLDIAKEAIVAAKNTFQHKNVTFIHADYDIIQSKLKNSFDVAVFHDSLHHSDDIVETLRSARLSLVDAGICITCEPGIGHSTSPDAIEAVEKYGVTEADMPPSKILSAAKIAGYSSHKIYASPALMHRALYREYKAGKKSLLRYFPTRVFAVLYFHLSQKRREGICVLYR